VSFNLRELVFEDEDRIFLKEVARKSLDFDNLVTINYFALDNMKILLYKSKLIIQDSLNHLLNYIGAVEEVSETEKYFNSVFEKNLGIVLRGLNTQSTKIENNLEYYLQQFQEIINIFDTLIIQSVVSTFSQKRYAPKKVLCHCLSSNANILASSFLASNLKGIQEINKNLTSMKTNIVGKKMMEEVDKKAKEKDNKKEETEEPEEESEYVEEGDDVGDIESSD